MRPGDLEGKVAIATGGGSGIGRATAQQLSREGAAVAVADIDAGRAKSVAEEIVADGGTAIAVEVDTRDLDSWRALVDTVTRELGALHAVHVHPGGGGDSTILNPNLAGFDAGIDLTLRGTFLGLVAVAPAIIASGGGAVVCTASTAGIMGQRGLTSYSAGKAGVMGLVRAAAAELAPHGVRVNAICPSVTYTGLFNWKFDSVEALDDALGQFHTLGRVGRPEDVANLVTFLLSDRAAWITAASYAIDGGATTTQSWGFHAAIDEMFAGAGRGPAT